MLRKRFVKNLRVLCFSENFGQVEYNKSWIVLQLSGSQDHEEASQCGHREHTKGC